MRVQDEAFYQQWRADVLADGSKTGETFVFFVQTWAEEAEKVMASHPTVGFSRSATVAQVLNFKLEPMEQQFGRVDAIYLGQAMAVLSMHWVYGEEMMRGLTPIERRLVEDCVILKVRAMQAQAEAATDAHVD